MGIKISFFKQCLSFFNNGLRNNEDAISEVLDFIIIIGILLLSIGLIGVAGYPILKTTQESQQIESTKQSFTVLAENFNKVVIGQAPSKRVELKMYGGTLSVTGNSSINITGNTIIINQSNNLPEPLTTLVDQPMRKIESEIGGTIIAYEGTGVWAKYPNGNTINVHKPLFTNVSDVLVIPVITIIGTSSMGGSGMGRVTADGEPTVTHYKNVSDIKIIVTSDYTKGWENYFKNIMSWTIVTSSGPSGELIAKIETPTNIDVYILDIRLNAKVI